MDRSPYETARLASADESLLVSPLLADFFTRGVNAHDEQRYVGKNLQSDIENAITKNDDRKLLVDGRTNQQLFMTKNEVQTTENFMNELSSSPIESGDTISPNAANLLQLDTSFCPSLGFGSVGSSGSEGEGDTKTNDKNNNSKTDTSDHSRTIHLSSDSHNAQTNPDIHPFFSTGPLPLLVIDPFPIDHPPESMGEVDTSESELYLSDTSTIENNEEEGGLSSLPNSCNDKSNGNMTDLSVVINREIESTSNGMHRYQDSITSLKENKEEQSHVAQETVSSSYSDAYLKPKADVGHNKQNVENNCLSVQKNCETKAKHAATTPDHSPRHPFHYFGSNMSSANLCSQTDNSNHQKHEEDQQPYYASVASLSVVTSCAKCSPMDTDLKIERQYHVASPKLLDLVDATPNGSNLKNKSSDYDTQCDTQSFHYNESLPNSNTSTSNRTTATTYMESVVSEKYIENESGVDGIQERNYQNVSNCRSDSDRSICPDTRLRTDATSSLEVWRSAAHRRKLKVVGSQQLKGAEPRLSSLQFAQYESSPKVQPKQPNVESRKAKVFAPEEDPYRPFKAKSLPKVLAGGATGVPKVEKRPITEPKSPCLGLRRTPGNVKLTQEETNYKRLQTQRRVTNFSAHPPLKRTIPSVSRKALEAEPFTGVLSGKEVCIISIAHDLLLACF
jgi:hypothetical protein